ncbi:MAG: hypothetical protein R2764_21690 [Bacteroidales bacterium]
MQSDDAQDGNSSVELKVLYHPVFMNFVRAGLFIDGNFPVDGRPGMLKGYFKGSAYGSDSLTIVVGMFKDGNPIGFGTYFTIQSVTNWTLFMVPFITLVERMPMRHLYQSMLASYLKVMKGQVI